MFCLWKTRNRKLLEKIMATVEEIKAVLTDVKSNSVEVSSKVTAVLNKLAELQAAGNGASQEQLADLLALATDVKNSQQATEDMIDAATTAASGEAAPSGEAPAGGEGTV